MFKTYIALERDTRLLCFPPSRWWLFGKGWKQYLAFNRLVLTNLRPFPIIQHRSALATASARNSGQNPYSKIDYMDGCCDPKKTCVEDLSKAWGRWCKVFLLPDIWNETFANDAISRNVETFRCLHTFSIKRFKTVAGVLRSCFVFSWPILWSKDDAKTCFLKIQR